MNDDVRKVIYGTIIGFLVVVLSWLEIDLSFCLWVYTFVLQGNTSGRTNAYSHFDSG